ncbi:hypothetical protein [Pseudomonas syringae]|uniref:hypothetical protein n=1 Tax=Pseudomonas syringae TaxID=317 RepID=UPI0004646E28|nr:hypothetical protein [Pseudomonas syringae]
MTSMTSVKDIATDNEFNLFALNKLDHPLRCVHSGVQIDPISLSMEGRIMPLAKQDKVHITALTQKLSSLLKPKYGFATWYTVAAGGWAPPRAPDQLISIKTSISGKEVGRLPGWALEASESSARKDAEVHLALAYNDELTYQTGGDPNVTPAGTLYIVVDKGPCRSCRKVLRGLRNYWGFRMVIYYRGEKEVLGRIGNMGFSDALTDPVIGKGHYVILE